MRSTLFLPAALQLTDTVFKLLAIAIFVSATPSPSQLEPHSRDVVLPIGWVPIGCYSDNAIQPTLTPTFLTTRDYNMTVSICTERCNDQNKSYAGLENGTECSCGNVLTDGATRILDGDCRTPCIGDSSQYCGGNNSLSLYRNGAPDLVLKMTKRKKKKKKKPEPEPNPNPNPNPNPDPIGGGTGQGHVIPVHGNPVQSTPIMPQYVDSWFLLGCFNDLDSRTLTHQVTLTGGQNTNSAENCISTCEFGGFPAAGMTNADECWCDYSIEPVSKEPIDSRNCMLVCPGNNLEICGGPSSTTIYAHILP